MKMHQTFPRFQRYIFIEKSSKNSKPAGVCKRIFAAFKVQPKYKNWSCFSNETTPSLLLHQTLRCLNWVMARDTDVVKDDKFSDFITGEYEEHDCIERWRSCC